MYTEQMTENKTPFDGIYSQ